jgi:NADPH-dependent glutamate synthase beta subunit-like oxidoreductase
MEKLYPELRIIPISYESTEVIRTGEWSSLKPVTIAAAAPCMEACPAGNNISEFIYLVQKGMLTEALQAVLMENPLPGVCGRVCYHPCEAGCNRAQFDEPVSIQMLERYVSGARLTRDKSIQPIPPKSPRNVAIVGSGPAGLACAYFLALLGHHPTIFESRNEPGGVMRWGIPEFRLPKTILRREIRRILSLPITLKTDCSVGRDVSFDELSRFDAIFLSPGAALGISLSVEGEELPGVWEGGEFLARINAGENVSLGKTTIVIGGGNTAMDVARSALRLGSDVTVAYRRTRKEMPAIREEIDEAEEEGIRFSFLLQPVKIARTDDGRLAVTFQRMQMGAPDESGRSRPVPLNEFVTTGADNVITAAGEAVDTSWLPESVSSGSVIQARPAPNIFAGGDAVPQPRTIVDAIAAGKKAAISMDLFFRGMEDVRDVLAKIAVGKRGAVSMAAYLEGRDAGNWPGAKGVVAPQRINTLYFEKSTRAGIRRLMRETRLRTFSEVNLAPSHEKAAQSALRCYSCGKCNACLNCYYFCPEGVVVVNPNTRTRTVDYAHCKGCGTCVKACPRYALEMEELQ